jgi:hypothetical protein
MKKIYYTLLFLTLSLNVLALKPTEITLSKKGHIKRMFFNIEEQTTKLLPLTSINVSGKSKLKSLQMKIEGQYYFFDEFGTLLTNYIGFNVIYDFDNKIESIRDQNNHVLYRFYYDFDGRLEKVKDKDYNTKFKLYYDFDGRLSSVQDDNYNKMINISTNFDNYIDGIKNEKYNYEYKFYYDFNNKIEKIKNNDYKLLAKINYNNGEVQNIEKYNGICSIVVENQYHQNVNQPNYGGNNNQNQPQYNSTLVASFYNSPSFQGQVLQLGVGNYPQLNINWNNKISSIIIPQGLKVIVYSKSNYTGDSMMLTNNWSSVGGTDIWNDRISSVVILQY